MNVKEVYNAPIIAALGNPLLDMRIIINSTDVLGKYGFDLDCEEEVTKEQLEELQELQNRYPSVLCAGGSAQNTLRFFQWLVDRPGASLMLGAVGRDDSGRAVEQLMRDAGVHIRYAYHDALPTGRCVALVKGKHRALLAHIGAAAVYEPHHLGTLGAASIVYIEGFFISHSYPVAREVVTICKARGTLIAFNLSSPYICKNNTQEVLQLVKYADVVFGNEVAYEALAGSSGQTTGSLVSLQPDEQSCVAGVRVHTEHRVPADVFRKLRSHGKVCIATNGPHPVTCRTACEECFEVPVPVLDDELVKDTTGAGDVFVAGFLAGVVHQDALEACIKLGCRAAAQVIQHVGCQVPTFSPTEILSAA